MTQLRIETPYMAQRSGSSTPVLPRTDPLYRLTIGALAGIVATVPMTLTMQYLRRRLPFWQRYPLPPHRVVTNTLRKLGIYRAERKQHTPIAHAAHYGYGALCGLLYALVSPSLPFPRLLNGMGFGLFVWVASYLGLMPALNILPPATYHPRQRNLLMIAAHFVWGLFTALLVGIFQQRDSST